MKGFKKRNRDKFIQNQIVAIKKTPHHKVKPRSEKTGRILEKLENDSYLVKVDNPLIKRNHKDINLNPLSVQ